MKIWSKKKLTGIIDGTREIGEAYMKQMRSPSTGPKHGEAVTAKRITSELTVTRIQTGPSVLPLLHYKLRRFHHGARLGIVIVI
jgi:hypothetical protein